MSTQQRREPPERSVMAHSRVIAQTAIAVLLLGTAVASFFLVYALLPEANQFGRDRTLRDLMAALRNLSQCPEKGTTSTRCNGQVLAIGELIDHTNKREFTFSVPAFSMPILPKIPSSSSGGPAPRRTSPGGWSHGAFGRPIPSPFPRNNSSVGNSASTCLSTTTAIWSAKPA